MNPGRKRYRYLVAIAAALVLVLGGIMLAWLWPLGEGTTSTGQPLSPAVPGDNAIPGWMVIAVAISSLTTLLAVGTSFYLYRWRRFLSTQPHLLLPEEHGRYLRQLERRIHKLQTQWGRLVPDLAARIDSVKEQSTELRSSFLTLQQSLDEKDREIARLKTGYDRHVFRSFVRRFLRVDRALADFIEGGEGTEALEQSRRLLQDALEECGISAFAPAIGESYADTTGVADEPKIVPVADADQDGLILSVLEPGYQIATADGSEVIQPAKVEVGAFEEQAPQEE